MESEHNFTFGKTEVRFPFHVFFNTFHSRTFGNHNHDFCELVLVRCGKGKFLLEKMQYDISAGDVFLIDAQEEHGYSDQGDLELCGFQFNADAFLDRNSDLLHLPGYSVLFHFEIAFRQNHKFRSKLHLDKNQLLQACYIITAIEKEYQEQQPGYHTMVTCHFGLLVGFLARQYVGPFTPETFEVMNLAKVTAYIQQNYQQPITLDELAKVACMSKNSLLRAFNRYYRDTPIAYLIDLRIRKASALLKLHDYSITEIAYIVGFSESSYFTRQFYRVHGMSPRQYRARTKSIP